MTVIVRRGANQRNARRSLGLDPETVTAGGNLAPDHGIGAVGPVLRNGAALGARAVTAAVRVEVVSAGGAAAEIIAAPGPEAKLLNSM